MTERPVCCECGRPVGRSGGRGGPRRRGRAGSVPAAAGELFLAPLALKFPRPSPDAYFMGKENVATERARLILQLGERGWSSAQAQRLTLVRLRLEVLKIDEPWIFGGLTSATDGLVIL